MTGFLKKAEFSRTLPLFKACFGEDRSFIDEYYGQDSPLYELGAVAVTEEDGRVLSMVHLIPMELVCGPVRGPEDAGETAASAAETACGPETPAECVIPAVYLLCVGTDPEWRGRGLMDRTMSFAMEEAEKAGCRRFFLVPVDMRIYRHLGFLYDWTFNEAERDLLCADEGLSLCSMRGPALPSAPRMIRLSRESLTLS